VQKGKKVHRGGRLLGAALGFLALSIALCGSIPAYSAAPEYCAWRFDENGPDVGSLPASFGVCHAGKRRVGVFSTIANPYMLEGLVASRFRAGFEGPLASVWLDWRRRGHVLYREDRLDAAFGLELPFEGCSFAVVPAMERREVRGFRAERAYSCRIAASYEYRGRACIGFARSVYESDPGAGPRSAAYFLIRGGAMTVALDHAASGPHAGTTRLAIEARLDGKCSIRFGYRWQTEELSSGLVAALSPVLLDFSWSQHPALGSTVSAGIGRLWEW
jgi:hypothetical protein